MQDPGQGRSHKVPLRDLMRAAQSKKKPLFRIQAACLASTTQTPAATISGVDGLSLHNAATHACGNGLSADAHADTASKPGGGVSVGLGASPVLPGDAAAPTLQESADGEVDLGMQSNQFVATANTPCGSPAVATAVAIKLPVLATAAATGATATAGAADLPVLATAADVGAYTEQLIRIGGAGGEDPAVRAAISQAGNDPEGDSFGAHASLILLGTGDTGTGQAAVRPFSFKFKVIRNVLKKGKLVLSKSRLLRAGLQGASDLGVISREGRAPHALTLQMGQVPVVFVLLVEPVKQQQRAQPQQEQGGPGAIARGPGHEQQMQEQGPSGGAGSTTTAAAAEVLVAAQEEDYDVHIRLPKKILTTAGVVMDDTLNFERLTDGSYRLTAYTSDGKPKASALALAAPEMAPTLVAAAPAAAGPCPRPPSGIVAGIGNGDDEFATGHGPVGAAPSTDPALQATRTGSSRGAAALEGDCIPGGPVPSGRGTDGAAGNVSVSKSGGDAEQRSDWDVNFGSGEGDGSPSPVGIQTNGGGKARNLSEARRGEQGGTGPANGAATIRGDTAGGGSFGERSERPRPPQTVAGAAAATATSPVACATPFAAADDAPTGGQGVDISQRGSATVAEALASVSGAAALRASACSEKTSMEATGDGSTSGKSATDDRRQPIVDSSKDDTAPRPPMQGPGAGGSKIIAAHGHAAKVTLGPSNELCCKVVCMKAWTSRQLYLPSVLLGPSGVFEGLSPGPVQFVEKGSKRNWMLTFRKTKHPSGHYVSPCKDMITDLGITKEECEKKSIELAFAAISDPIAATAALAPSMNALAAGSTTGETDAAHQIPCFTVEARKLPHWTAPMPGAKTNTESGAPLVSGPYPSQQAILTISQLGSEDPKVQRKEAARAKAEAVASYISAPNEVLALASALGPAPLVPLTPVDPVRTAVEDLTLARLRNQSRPQLERRFISIGELARGDDSASPQGAAPELKLCGVVFTAGPAAAQARAAAAAWLSRSRRAAAGHGGSGAGCPAVDGNWEIPGLDAAGRTLPGWQRKHWHALFTLVNPSMDLDLDPHRDKRSESSASAAVVAPKARLSIVAVLRSLNKLVKQYHPCKANRQAQKQQQQQQEAEAEGRDLQHGPGQHSGGGAGRELLPVGRVQIGSLRACRDEARGGLGVCTDAALAAGKVVGVLSGYVLKGQRHGPWDEDGGGGDGGCRSASTVYGAHVIDHSACDAAVYVRDGYKFIKDDHLKEELRRRGGGDLDCAWQFLALSYQFSYPEELSEVAARAQGSADGGPNGNDSAVPAAGGQRPQPFVMCMLGHGGVLSLLNDPSHISLQMIQQNGSPPSRPPQAGAQANCVVIPAAYLGVVLPVVVTLRPLLPGDQLLVDYSMGWWRELADAWEMAKEFGVEPSQLLHEPETLEAVGSPAHPPPDVAMAVAPLPSSALAIPHPLLNAAMAVAPLTSPSIDSPPSPPDVAMAVAPLTSSSMDMSTPSPPRPSRPLDLQSVPIWLPPPSLPMDSPPLPQSPPPPLPKSPPPDFPPLPLARPPPLWDLSPRPSSPQPVTAAAAAASLQAPSPRPLWKGSMNVSGSALDGCHHSVPVPVPEHLPPSQVLLQQQPHVHAAAATADKRPDKDCGYGGSPRLKGFHSRKRLRSNSYERDRDRDRSRSHTREGTQDWWPRASGDGTAGQDRSKSPIYGQDRDGWHHREERHRKLDQYRERDGDWDRERDWEGDCKRDRDWQRDRDYLKQWRFPSRPRSRSRSRERDWGYRTSRDYRHPPDRDLRDRNTYSHDHRDWKRDGGRSRDRRETAGDSALELGPEWKRKRPKEVKELEKRRAAERHGHGHKSHGQVAKPAAPEKLVGLSLDPAASILPSPTVGSLPGGVGGAAGHMSAIAEPSACREVDTLGKTDAGMQVKRIKVLERDRSFKSAAVAPAATPAMAVDPVGAQTSDAEMAPKWASSSALAAAAAPPASAPMSSAAAVPARAVVNTHGNHSPHTAAGVMARLSELRVTTYCRSPALGPQPQLAQLQQQKDAEQAQPQLLLSDPGWIPVSAAVADPGLTAVRMGTDAPLQHTVQSLPVASEHALQAIPTGANVRVCGLSQTSKRTMSVERGVHIGQQEVSVRAAKRKPKTIATGVDVEDPSLTQKDSLGLGSAAEVVSESIEISAIGEAANSGQTITTAAGVANGSGKSGRKRSGSKKSRLAGKSGSKHPYDPFSDRYRSKKGILESVVSINELGFEEVLLQRMEEVSKRRHPLGIIRTRGNRATIDATGDDAQQKSLRKGRNCLESTRGSSGQPDPGIRGHAVTSEASESDADTSPNLYDWLEGLRMEHLQEVLGGRPGYLRDPWRTDKPGPGPHST
ncbi:hypothetical protein VaNZ11_012761 [Volvox africanus]|uniref:SET domain-containing protein n=1 Tax=Volvox africanus TaxID=51714 RepID=A0ABQ5SEL1_9CHLO|nr:hypothetical protein VaNZ11_012761 [Volvox africanus]